MAANQLIASAFRKAQEAIAEELGNDPEAVAHADPEDPDALYHYAWVWYCGWEAMSELWDLIDWAWIAEQIRPE